VGSYPEAVQNRLPEDTTQPAHPKTQVIVHTMVGTLKGTARYFGQPGVKVESTFGVADDGTVHQWLDSERRADANYQANLRAISIETEDDGDPTRPWTRPQAQALIDLITWCCRAHRIPPVFCETPTTPGVAWHAQFGAPSAFTNVPGKICPGPVRIAQLRGEILPAVRKALNPPDPHGGPVTADQVWQHPLPDPANPAPGATRTAESMLGLIYRHVEILLSMAEDAEARLNALQDRAEAPAKGTTP
jgi:N-acetylmuramoyl-L-alanine amidase